MSIARLGRLAASRIEQAAPPVFILTPCRASVCLAGWLTSSGPPWNGLALDGFRGCSRDIVDVVCWRQVIRSGHECHGNLTAAVDPLCGVDATGGRLWRSIGAGDLTIRRGWEVGEERSRGIHHVHPRQNGYVEPNHKLSVSKAKEDETKQVLIGWSSRELGKQVLVGIKKLSLGDNYSLSF